MPTPAQKLAIVYELMEREEPVRDEYGEFVYDKNGEQIVKKLGFLSAEECRKLLDFPSE